MARAAKKKTLDQPDFLANDGRWSKSEKDKIAQIAWDQSGGIETLYNTLMREHCSGGLDLFETEKKPSNE